MRKYLGILNDYLFITVGCVSYALGFTVFIYPNHISPGGVTGISTILNQFFPFIPIGLATIVINLPLIIIGLIKFRISFVIKTAFATVASSVFIDVFLKYVPVYSADRLLADIAAGVLVGTGLGLIMLKGGTTGGTDIVAKLVNLKYRFLSLGRLMLFIDAVIVSVAAFVYRDFESLLYSVLFLFISGTVMDRLIYGADYGKIVYIVTEEAKAITETIFGSIGRGITQIKAVGGYTGEDRNLLMCVARAHEVSRIIHIVRNTDPNAFTVISDAGEILGQGFKQLRS